MNRIPAGVVLPIQSPATPGSCLEWRHHPGRPQADVRFQPEDAADACQRVFNISIIINIIYLLDCII